MIAALASTLKKTPVQLGLLKVGDWAGNVTMAIGLAALQTVLEEGNKDDWFALPSILELALVAAVFLAIFIAIELTVNNPLVNLRLLKRRNFGVGVIAYVLVGFALFAASCFMNVTLSPDSAGDQFWLPNIVRAIGQALIITPVSAITTGGIARMKRAQKLGVAGGRGH